MKMVLWAVTCHPPPPLIHYATLFLTLHSQISFSPTRPFTRLTPRSTFPWGEIRNVRFSNQTFTITPVDKKGKVRILTELIYIAFTLSPYLSLPTSPFSFLYLIITLCTHTRHRNRIVTFIHTSMFSPPNGSI